MKSPGLKKILILDENLPVPFDRRVWMEATTLVKAGYRVAVICPQGSYPTRYEVIQGVSIYRVPIPSLPGILGHLVEYALALTLMFIFTWVVYFREGFDFIQSANPPDFFFIIGRLFQLLGKKFVFDHHDLVPESCDARWSGMKLQITRAISRWAEGATFKTADRVISTNQSYREVAIGRGKVLPEKVYVVRSGPSLKQFVPSPAQAKWKNGRSFLVGYLGVMGPNDGIDYLLQAIRHLTYERGFIDVHFTLIGDGDLQSQMVELSRQMGLSDFVEFTGRISDEDMLAILSTADVCVAPDPKDQINDLCTMNKIIEYMALAKPLVAFDLREARVSAGESALYARANDSVDFAEKILWLLSHPEQRQEMGSLGRQRFESALAWEHQQTNLLALYQGLSRDGDSA